VSQAAVAPSKVSGHTILAFDFGERWIGVAVGDTETRLASPLGMFEAESSSRRMSEVESLLREWRPERLLVGLPLALHISRVRRERHTGEPLMVTEAWLPVDLADERLSSASAESALREAGRGSRKHKHEVHALAAKVILQSYLDESPGR